VDAQASSTAVSVLEACPKQADLRLTLLKPADEEDTPDTKYVPQPGVVDDSGARVVAVADTTTAVYVPTPKPTVNIVDETGATVASTLVPKPPSPNATMSRAGDLVTWWTGDSVMVFSANGLRYRYTVTASGSNVPLGPATMMAGRLLVPVTGGYDVFDPATGDGGGGFVDHRAARRRTGRAGLVSAEHSGHSEITGCSQCATCARNLSASRRLETCWAISARLLSMRAIRLPRSRRASSLISASDNPAC
jgi:hypothetical protein